MLLNSVQGRKLNFRGKPDVDEEEVNGLIKVALLDTGVDLTHPELEDYLNNGQLHMGLDLVDQENHDGPVIDLDGHGTHMCHTLLRTAPYAMVYPVRVFKDRHTLDQDEESRSASLVAKVPTYLKDMNIFLSALFPLNIDSELADISRLSIMLSRNGE